MGEGRGGKPKEGGRRSKEEEWGSKSERGSGRGSKKGGERREG